LNLKAWIQIKVNWNSGECCAVLCKMVQVISKYELSDKIM